MYKALAGGPTQFFLGGIVVLTDIIAILLTPGNFLKQICIKLISMVKKYRNAFSQLIN